MNKRIKSFGFAFRGIKSAIISEMNMKIHIVIACMVVVSGILFHISTEEWLLCLICFGFVISMEMLNTAIECLVDLVSPEYHPLAGRAKDIAAGAVLISALFSALVGLIIFVPKGLLLINKLF